MEDVGFTLVLAYAFIGPWLFRTFGVPEYLVRLAAVLALILLGLAVFDYVHVWLPKAVGRPLTVALLLAVGVRAWFEAFPRDRGKPAGIPRT